MAKSSIEKYKSFEKWKAQEVENEFKVKRDFYKPDYLTSFLDISNVEPANSEEKAKIEFIQNRLVRMVDVWNEFDMSIIFIGQLLEIVDFQKYTYRAFFNHSVKAIINGKEIGGRIDCMLAKGRQIPELPLFFIQEYKPTSGPNGDPIGQLLIEMIAAQSLNNEPDEPIYGCYIIGRNWFFVVLQGSEYAISSPYVATESDIYEIICVLKKVKIMFEKKIGYVEENI